MRILVAEHDQPVARFVRKGLGEEAYAVDLVTAGDEAEFMAQEYDYDLVILDLGLPGVDGHDILKHMRERKNSVPVLVLSGRSSVEDRVRTLDLGADDYLSKPFSFSELSARVRALLRRANKPVESVLRVEDLQLDRIARVVQRGPQKITLTLKEFALLEYLMRNAARPVTRAMIIEHVWDISFDTMTNVVDVYINYLRKKVCGGHKRKLIQTVRGVGYQLG